MLSIFFFQNRQIYHCVKKGGVHRCLVSRYWCCWQYLWLEYRRDTSVHLDWINYSSPQLQEHMAGKTSCVWQSFLFRNVVLVYVCNVGKTKKNIDKKGNQFYGKVMDSKYIKFCFKFRDFPTNFCILMSQNVFSKMYQSRII